MEKVLEEVYEDGDIQPLSKTVMLHLDKELWELFFAMKRVCRQRNNLCLVRFHRLISSNQMIWRNHKNAQVPGDPGTCAQPPLLFDIEDYDPDDPHTVQDKVPFP
jgi:hypothetical protein